MHEDLLAFLRAEGIATLDVRAALRVEAYWDVTDHLTPEANVRLAEELARLVR
jgi:hypothetical protein